jgi:Smg protein
MKEESVLNVLMYLFHHHKEKDDRINLNDSKIINELKSAGFHAHSIGKAFHWLHHLTAVSDSFLQQTSIQSFRVFSENETSLIDEDCRRFILSLEQQGILTPVTREVVIHQTMELIHEGVDLSLIKWVTLMVLFNLPNCEEALTHMEFLVNSDAYDTVH